MKHLRIVGIFFFVIFLGISQLSLDANAQINPAATKPPTAGSAPVTVVNEPNMPVPVSGNVVITNTTPLPVKVDAFGGGATAPVLVTNTTPLPVTGTLTPAQPVRETLAIFVQTWNGAQNAHVDVGLSNPAIIESVSVPAAPGCGWFLTPGDPPVPTVLQVETYESSTANIGLFECGGATQCQNASGSYNSYKAAQQQFAWEFMSILSPVVTSIPTGTNFRVLFMPRTTAFGGSFQCKAVFVLRYVP